MSASASSAPSIRTTESAFSRIRGKRTDPKSARRQFRPLIAALEERAVPAVVIQSLTPLVGALEGTAASGPLAQFTGSSTNVNDYTANVSWGDGTSTVLTAANGGIVDNGNGTFTVSASNTFAEEGNPTLSVTITDATGASATQSATQSVGDAALTGNYPAMINGVPNTPLSTGSMVVATFTDNNPNAPASDFTATIAWGDGTIDTVSAANGGIVPVAGAPGQWNVLGNHTYTSATSYNLVVTLQDVGGASATASVPTIVANPSPLSVTPYDPSTPLSTLTNALLTPGTGLNLVGSSYVGQNGQAGTYNGFSFHDQNSSLSLANGVLLTSGSAVNALGPNNTPSATTAYGTPTNPMGDPALDALVSPDITYDANSLTLQFTANPGVSSIQFQFVFGSEEFPEWVGLYNDVFAAFLDGKQISFDPAGNPISVNNNFFQLNNSGDFANPNTAGKTVVGYDIQYDGLTPALTTKAALDPTITTHTLTFSIADTRDQVLDSGVFLTSLSGNGTSSGTVTAKAPQANAGGTYTVEAGKSVQLNGSGTTDTSQAPGTLTYQWDLNGNGTFGETGTAATNGNEVGMTPTFVAAGLTPGTSVTVPLQVIDSNGLVSTDQAVINVIAPVLTVNSVAPPTATEGQPTGTQTLATFTDANASANALSAVVSWGDGQSSTLTAANGGIATNTDGSFSVVGGHTFAEEASGLTFTVQVTDANGSTTAASALLNVADAAVTASGGLTIVAKQGAALSGVTVANFTDPGGAEPNTADTTGTHYSADIAWGDGSTSAGTITFDPNTNSFKVLGSHTYAATGNYVITVSVHHESAPTATTTSTAAISSVGVTPVSIGQGPGGPNTLLINGTPGNDVIRVVPQGDKGAVRVLINGISQGVYAKNSFTAIALYGQAGNDNMKVDQDIKAPAYLFGGAGNDVLIAGGGPTLLDGGTGNDTLIGGEGPSVLIGGGGADVLTAGDGNAVLIGGRTDFQDPTTLANNQTLNNLLSAWSDQTKTSAARVAAVDAVLAGHVSSDGQTDVLNGGDGLDLCFMSPSSVLHGKKKGDIVMTI